MSDIGRVDFETGSVKADDRFIREYVLDAIERLPELEECKRVGYVRRRPGAIEGVKGGIVSLLIQGDIGGVIDNEQDRWNELAQVGPVNNWWVDEQFDREALEATFGDRGTEEYMRLHYLAAAMSRSAFDEFENRPAPVDIHPDEKKDTPPLGWWTVLQFLTHHWGYSPNDALRMYANGIERTLENIAENDPDRAQAWVDDLVDHLGTVSDEFQGNDDP